MSEDYEHTLSKAAGSVPVYVGHEDRSKRASWQCILHTLECSCGAPYLKVPMSKVQYTCLVKQERHPLCISIAYISVG